VAAYLGFRSSLSEGAEDLSRPATLSRAFWFVSTGRQEATTPSTRIYIGIFITKKSTFISDLPRRIIAIPYRRLGETDRYISKGQIVQELPFYAA
jgi:hypothetical protein